MANLKLTLNNGTFLELNNGSDLELNLLDSLVSGRVAEVAEAIDRSASVEVVDRLATVEVGP